MDNQKRRRNVKRSGVPPEDSKKKTPPRRYNLRKRPAKEDVEWVDEDLSSDTSDSDFEEEESLEEEQEIHGVKVPANVPVSVKIHVHTTVNEDDDEDEDYEDEDEEDDEDEDDEEESLDDFLLHLLDKYGAGSKKRRGTDQPFIIITDEGGSGGMKKSSSLDSLLKLSKEERDYFDELPKKQQKKTNEKMKAIAKLLKDGEVPSKFRVIDLSIPDATKAAVIKKIDTLKKMGFDSGESHKLRTWVDGFLRIPFGKQIPLPVTMKDGPDKCAGFLVDAQRTLDAAVYGMQPVKTQVMQILAQWIVNPGSVGNVIALKGSAGVGKTSIARNGIAAALKRPFAFFSLGGASDISHFVGHSYTYEGSIWGRIVDSLITAGCMNPVFYFDELDKISSTPHGEEITAMMIHLTDRSQNMQYHDRYFAGVDFDLSQCLFVFSFNDENKVHPILKDRMQVIHCSGYDEKEKKVILTQYVWPSLLERLSFKPEDLILTDDAIKFLIQEHSKGEEGVRTLIRVVETVITRLNLLRIAGKQDDLAKRLKFAMDITFPLTITRDVVEKLLSDLGGNAAMKDLPLGMYT
jgi:ATP-dependent Lon protease